VTLEYPHAVTASMCKEGFITFYLNVVTLYGHKKVLRVTLYFTASYMLHVLIVITVHNYM